jgi:DNA-binding transcriptional regulator YiaG
MSSRRATSVALQLTPDEIRRIRESLGLSKAEAGELIGGGPRAFTKYESGTIQPAAAVSNLLRLLDANPSALKTLLGKRAPPSERIDPGPLRVTGDHVAVLSDRKLAALTTRLLSAEALSHGLPAERLHVSSRHTSTDEGEDARVEWDAGPERTPFLPARRCLFQLKATNVSPAEAAADICTSAGRIEPVIRNFIEDRGAYVVLCARLLTKKQIRAREDRISATMAKEGIAFDRTLIQFRDADQIAEWVNRHPAVAGWLLEQTQPGLIGPFRDWTHWAGRYEHERSPLVPDPRLPSFRKSLCAEATKVRSVVRIVGYAGVGKSRLTLEALGGEDEDCSARLRDLVIYALESEAGATETKRTVQALADAGVRAIVVVDRCAPETHTDLAAIVKRSDSCLSLVTMDHEIPVGSVAADLQLCVDEADTSVIEGMLNVRTSGLGTEDRRRLLKFAAGSPLMAILVSQAWNAGEPISTATDETLINAIIFGRRARNADLLLDASLRLSAFGLVGAKPPRDQDLATIGALGRPWTTDELRVAFGELAIRGVVQTRGRLVTVQPLPVALALAQRQWQQWGTERWDEVLTGTLPAHLRVNAARRLSLLNAKSPSGKGAVAIDVVRHVCRLGGPLDSVPKLSEQGATEVVAQLAEVDTESVVTLIEHAINGLSADQLRSIEGDVRRHLCWALQKIAFVPATFERGAFLLLRLAVAENETWSNNSTGMFRALFPVLGGDTAAGAEERLRVLDETLKTDDAQQLAIGVNALLAGAETQSFIRSVGAEIHGSRPALRPWQPQLWRDAWDYVTACLDRLAILALRSDSIGERARAGLGNTFRSLVNRGLIDVVERLVRQVVATHPYWPAALNSLGDILQYDYEGAQPNLIARVRGLVDVLTPRAFSDRVRYLITEMPWDYPEDEQLSFEVRGERQVEAIRQLTRDLLASAHPIEGLLPQLSQGEQRKAFEFGAALAELSAEPLQWHDPILRAIESVEEDKRNFVLLTGYFAALSKRHPEVTETFKNMAWDSRVFAPALPLVSWAMNIAPADIELVCKSLVGGYIAPRHLAQWQCGGVLARLPASAVAPLFDQLLAMDVDGFSHAVCLMGMYVHGARGRLEELRPQLVRAAHVMRPNSLRRYTQSDAHYFKELMKWLLCKGASDLDAREAALSLAKSLSGSSDYESGKMIRPLLPTLLSTFAETVWPILGQAIVGDQNTRWELEHALGDPYTFSDEKSPPVLMLPEALLFGWCHANPTVAPAFLAAIVPLLLDRGAPPQEQQFHPVTLRLLKEFGERDDVLDALTRNMHTFSWSGSVQNYYALLERPLSDLEQHPVGSVRRWAHNQLQQVMKERATAKNHDEETQAAWDT